MRRPLSGGSSEEVVGADWGVGDERGGKLELAVELLGGIEVIDESAVFITDPAGAGFAGAGVEDEALGVEGQAVGDSAVALGRVAQRRRERWCRKD